MTNKPVYAEKSAEDLLEILVGSVMFFIDLIDENAEGYESHAQEIHNVCEAFVWQEEEIERQMGLEPDYGDFWNDDEITYFIHAFNPETGEYEEREIDDADLD